MIRGEAGIGKTALLDYASERAGDMTVVRALGVESEAQLEFSGLLEVCWPMRDALDELPAHQAGVLRSALGIGPAEEQDRFSVGAATLSLLAAAAEANPVCVVVDDAQWLDPASQEALVFATKRLQADRAVLLFGARDGEERPFEAPGVESIPGASKLRSSPSRAAESSATRSASSRLIANISASCEERSSQCASSTTTNSGWASAAAASRLSVAAPTAKRSCASPGPSPSAARSESA